MPDSNEVAHHVHLEAGHMLCANAGAEDQSRKPLSVQQLARAQRQSPAKMLRDAIHGDQYDADAQAAADAGAQQGGLPRQARQFIDMFLPARQFTKGLEAGIGQWAYPRPGITHAVDPSEPMVNSLLARLPMDGMNLLAGSVMQTDLEHVELDGFDHVVFLNGFFQVRSDYECLIQINRMLEHHGRFVVNIFTDDNEDIICGRVYGANNFQRCVEEFGFALVARLDNVGVDGNTYFCFQKVRPFRVEALRKLQLVHIGELDGDGVFTATGKKYQGCKVYAANNLDAYGRDAKLL